MTDTTDDTTARIETETTIELADGRMTVELTEPGAFEKALLAAEAPTAIKEAEEDEEIEATPEIVEFAKEFITTVSDIDEVILEKISMDAFEQLIDDCGTVFEGEEPTETEAGDGYVPDQIGNIELNEDGTVDLEEVR